MIFTIVLLEALGTLINVAPQYSELSSFYINLYSIDLVCIVLRLYKCIF